MTRFKQITTLKDAVLRYFVLFLATLLFTDVNSFRWSYHKPIFVISLFNFKIYIAGRIGEECFEYQYGRSAIKIGSLDWNAKLDMPKI